MKVALNLDNVTVNHFDRDHGKKGRCRCVVVASTVFLTVVVALSFAILTTGTQPIFSF